jgi:hypothetical protein
LAWPAFAASQTVGVNAGSTGAVAIAPGAKLTVPIIIDLTSAGAVKIAALQTGITWGVARLTLDSVRVAPVAGWTITPNIANAATGSIALSASGAAELVTTTTIANAFFTAGAGGTRVLIAPSAAANASAQDILPFVRARALDVCVAPTVKWGDVNDDGSADIIDAQQIARLTVSLSVADPVAMAQRGDVTANGVVDIIDAQQIARYTVALSAAARINTDFAIVAAPTGLTVSPSVGQSLVVGASLQLLATPVAAAVDLSGCSGVLWGSSNAAVATVNSSGYVTALTAGTATITATSAVNGALSASVNVTNTGVASQLAIATQPGGAAGGAAFSVQPAVELRYVTGFLVPNATNAVTATLTSGSGTLLGTTTVNAVNGVVTFTNLRIDAVGDKQLTFGGAGLLGAVSATFTVGPALNTVVNVASTAGTTGTLIPSFTPVTASGGTPPYGFALSGGTLPTGMSFSTSTGTVSGTPTTALAATTFTITVTDAGAATSAKTFTLTVNPALTTTQAVATRAGTNGTLIPAFTPVTASGGTTPYAFALSGATLPTGMSFSTTTGAVSGTPTTTLVSTTFTVTVTDAVGASSGKTFTLTVNPALTTTQAVATTVGTSGAAIASFTPVTASGGTTPYTFALTGGTLPTGMSFSTTTGTVSGTPTTTLVATTFTVTVTDAAGAISAKTFALTVNAALATTLVVPSKVGTAGTLIPSFTPVTASAGTIPYAFALSSGTLPTGMSFSTSTGVVSGTPATALAVTSFTVTVTDAAGATSAKTFTLTVNAALATAQAVPTTVGTVNTLISSFTPVTASGGTTPYAYALSGATLPTGMSFSTTTGTVSGTPSTTLTTAVFTVTVTDAAAATSAKTFSLTVNSALTTTQAVATKVGTSGAAIASFTPVTASGGTTPYSFALTGGVLPTGMSFNTTTGAVSGTPTTTLAATTFTVTATDAAGATSAKTFALTVNVAVSTTAVVPSTVGTAGTLIPSFAPVTASGGTTPYAFALSGASLPTGMSFSTSTGTVSGTPATALAVTTYTVTVTDAAGAISAKTFTLTVNSALVATQAVASRAGTIGTLLATFTPVTASGGTTPYGFALSGGTLPTGMSFNTSTGAVSGTPVATLATTTFTVTVTDAASATSAQTFSLTVNSALTTAQAVPATTGAAGSAIPAFTPVTASGGTLPYVFALSGATLPSGMGFATSTGVVSGTPASASALTTFTVTVTDAAGATSAKTFTLTINVALSTTQAVATTTGTVNTLIPSFTPVTASGGLAPYAFALSGGSLPVGMSFSTTTGQVSGTPTTTLVTTTFTVTVTDAVAGISAKTFALTVNPALVTTQAVATKVGTSGAAIATFTPVTASGGTAPYTFALSGGTLPTGMSFSTTTGAVSGTPTATLAATTFTVTVTDAATATSSKTFALTVNAAVVAAQAVASRIWTVNALLPSFAPVTASGGTTPYTFAISGGSLPTGLSFSTTSGQVSGTPSTTLTVTTFTVTVTDAANATSFATFQLTINGPVVANQSVPSTTLQVVHPIRPAITPFTPITGSGGTAPYTFAITSGVLPAGLSFDTSTGQITGKPSTLLPTPTTFTVQVTDVATATASNTFALTVNGIEVTLSSSATQSVQSGTDITVPILIDMSHRGTDDLASIAITVTWDPAKLTYLSSAAGNWPGGPALTPNDLNAGTGTFLLSAFAATGATADFTLYTITLHANATLGAFPVAVTVNSAGKEAGSAILVTPRSVTVTIIP